jgi:hypothetical protein
MIDKIILSTDRKSATIHYDTHSVGLYHSEAKVLDLLAVILNPANTTVSTWDEYTEIIKSSQEDTVIIKIAS